MSSTYLSLHYHLVFSTRDRQPLILPEWRERLHEYMGGTIQGLKGLPQGSGGVADHVHLLIGLKATHCLADVVRELKKSATSWVRDEIGENRFGWQDGYAAFTISAPSRKAVQEYIRNQERHHRKKSFREELISRRRECSTIRRISIDSRWDPSGVRFTFHGKPGVSAYRPQPPANGLDPSGVKSALTG